MPPSALHVDLLVIGSGPAGQWAALEAAAARRQVALVERRQVVGGVCIHTGTIPSKTLREAVLYLTGFHERTVYGESWSVKGRVTMDDLFRHTHHVMRREIEVVEGQLRRAGVTVLHGAARFEGPGVVVLDGTERERRIQAERVILAVGTSPHRPPGICFQPGRIVDSDEILDLAEVPASMVVVGGGVVGLEYATIFAALGTRVTLLDGRTRLLDFVDRELVAALEAQFEERGGHLRLGETLASVGCPEGGPVHAVTGGGEAILCDVLLYAAGRVGAVAGLDLDRVGVAADSRGRVSVDPTFRTSAPGVWAAGDVVGFPSLASTSMEQGRRAARHALGLPAAPLAPDFPMGIYTVPEIGTAGQTEEQLRTAGVPCVAGVARYRDVARGVILGDPGGFLKLLFHAGDRRLLGVHALGRNATELVHVGQVVMAFGGTLDFFLERVFNYPTLAECYKVAARDALAKLDP